MSWLPFALPSYVRLNRRLGMDQVVTASIDGWWRFEDPLPAVLAALAGETGGAFYDVGANTGFYSVLIGRLAPGRTVRAFEPVPEIVGFLEQNLAIAGLAERIAVEEVARPVPVAPQRYTCRRAGMGWSSPVPPCCRISSPQWPRWCWSRPRRSTLRMPGSVGSGSDSSRSMSRVPSTW